MHYRITLLIFALLGLIRVSFGQQEGEVTASSSDSESYYLDFLNTAGDSLEEKSMYKPSIGVGYGSFMFMGDVNDSYRNFAVGRQGLRLIVSRRVNSFLEMDYSVIKGKLSGTEISGDRHLNFVTDLLCGGVSARYNFSHLFKERDALLASETFRTKVRPFVSLGLEAFEYSSKGDLRDANGYAYHYWSDGTIRNITENPETASNSIILKRDYVYETDLREQDIDGYGKYPLIAFAIPLELGFQADLSDRVSVRLSTTLHMSFNDKVDNIARTGEGDRAGDRLKDNFLFTAFSVHYDLFRERNVPSCYRQIDLLDISTFEFIDEDKDNVKDLYDECAYTEPGVKVDAKGCPVDDDKDGIAQYLDDEAASLAGAIVDIKGVTMTEDVVGDTLAILHSELCDWYPSMCQDDRGKAWMKGFLTIPDEYKSFDLNNDEYISFEEFNEIIDNWFDYQIDLSIDDVMRLNQFFFDQ